MHLFMVRIYAVFVTHLFMHFVTVRIKGIIKPSCHLSLFILKGTVLFAISRASVISWKLVQHHRQPSSFA